MSRDFTLFQFDVDEETLRSVLSSIPGVTPLPPDDRKASDAERDLTGDESAASTEVSDEVTAGRAPERPGAEAHLSGSVGPGADRAGAQKWTGPSTPWPGAPADDDEDGGWMDRLRENRLLVGAAVAAVGLVSAVAVWFLKFRDGSGGNDGTGRPDPTDREPHAEDDASRSYPVDAAPVVGMAFLAVGTVLVRRFHGDPEE